MQAVKNFLTTLLNLEVSTKKSGICKASKGARFLGYDIQTWTSDCKVVEHRKEGHKGVKRSVSERIRLHVSREKVQTFTSRNGYGLYEACKGMHRKGLIHCDDVELFHIYNAELHGFANYYALAYQVKQKLNKLQLIWQTTLFRTLAAKQKTTVVKVMARCKFSPGNYVVWQMVNGKRINAKIWSLRELVSKVNTDERIDNRFQMAKIALAGTRYVDRTTAQQCSSCGSTEGPFEVHHKNPMRKRNHKAPEGRQRKTEVLCNECHKLLHAGRLPDRRDRVDGNGESDEAKVSSPVRWGERGVLHETPPSLPNTSFAPSWATTSATTPGC